MDAVDDRQLSLFGGALKPIPVEVESEPEPPKQTESEKVEANAYLELLCSEREHLIFLWGRGGVCNLRTHAHEELRTDAWVVREDADRILRENGYQRSSIQRKGSLKAVVYRRLK